MFGEGYFFISFEGIAGLTVTIIGIWLVVNQLNESRKATELNSILALQEKAALIAQDAAILEEVAQSKEWDVLSDDEAFEKIQTTQSLNGAFARVASFFEMMGYLVGRGTLSADIAYNLFGPVVTMWWGYFEKYSRGIRKLENLSLWGEHWEWLAKEFENYAG